MYYLCEIEDDNDLIKIALPKEKVIGISDKVVKSTKTCDFALHKNKLYPILTHADLKNPKLKFFLIFKDFAFGITRLVKETKSTPIEIIKNELYTGLIKDIEEYFIYNIEKLKPAQKVRYLDRNDNNKFDEGKFNYVIVDRKYAISINNILTILLSKEIVKYPMEKFIGFVEYKKIIPVKQVKEGKYVIITKDIAYQCSDIETANGKVLEGEDEKVLESNIGKFPILEWYVWIFLKFFSQN